MKTLAQYEKEFNEIQKPKDNNWLPENLASYEKLANECIADYPDDKLGYLHLGMSFANVDNSLSTDRLQAYYELSKKDDRFATASESIIKNNIYIPNGEIPEYLFRKEKPIYAELYFLCGEHFAGAGWFDVAVKEFEIAIKFGIDKQKCFDLLVPEIKDITIENFFCLKNLSLRGIEKNKELYFLGENGVGKTLLLQAIILGFIKNEYRNETYATYPFELNHEGKIDSILNIQTYHDRGSFHEHIFAYGVNRVQIGSVTDERYDTTGYKTLFERDRYLTIVEDWLKDIQRKELLKTSKISLSATLAFLKHIINIDSNIELQIFFDKKSDKFLFIEKDSVTEFKHLADGYRSVLIWLCDLLRRLTEKQPYVTDIKDFHGIVLIDEIDMFLHPKWEYKIVQKLREKLPNIQWFFTTHSPMLVLGASEDAVFYKLYKENGETKISEAWHTHELYHLLANGIITSPLFDMASPQMSSFSGDRHKLDTSPTFWHSKINEKIIQQIENQKNEGKGYFSKLDIDKIVEWAINEMEQK